MRNILLALLVTAFILPGVVAETHSKPSVTDQAEHMDNTIGKEVRSLQLEISIERNVVLATETLAFLEERNITDESLENLSAQIQANLDYVKNNTPLEREDFIAIKHDTKNLTTQFKNITHTYIDDEQRSMIIQRAQGTLTNLSRSRGDRVQELVQQYNKRRVSDMMNGTERDDEIQERIEEENLSKIEVAELVRQNIRDLPEQARANVTEKIRRDKQERQRSVEQATQGLDRALENVKEARNARAQEVLERVKNKIENRRRGPPHNLSESNETEDDLENYYIGPPERHNETEDNSDDVNESYRSPPRTRGNETHGGAY